MEDIPLISRYWYGLTPAELNRMGADPSKMPNKEAFEQMLTEQLAASMEEKQGFATIWLVNDTPVGHCNINGIQFGRQANMHLHLWNPSTRQKGMGANLVKQSLPLFFENFQLESLFCEPYALNPAPNKTLEKIGFELLKEYVTTPGLINFEQPVKRWVLTHAKWKTF